MTWAANVRRSITGLSWGWHMSARISRQVIDGNLDCHCKGWLRLVGENGVWSDYARMTSEEEGNAASRSLTHLLSCYLEGKHCHGAPLCATDLRQGLSVLVDAIIENEQATVLFDGLVRVDGPSQLGDFHYQPIICQAGIAIRTKTRRLLAILGLVLGSVQGRLPTDGIVIAGREGRQTRVKLTEKLHRQAIDALAFLKNVLSNASAPLLTLNDHCEMCEFRQRCHAEAVREDNIVPPPGHERK